MDYCNIGFMPYTVHIYPHDLFNNCKFVPLNLPDLFHSSPHSLPSGNHVFVLCEFVSVLLCFLICFLVHT